MMLLQVTSAEDAFCILVALINNYALIMLPSDKYIRDQLILKYMPNLHKHLQSNKSIKDTISTMCDLWQ